MVPDQPTNPHFQKIGILRCGAIGDMLVVLPALNALRNHFLNAEIVLLTDPFSASYTNEGRFPVNRIITLPPIQGICPNGDQHWKSLPDLLKTLQLESFDLLLNFQGKGSAANTFIEACRPKHSISFKTEDTTIHVTTQYSYYQPEVMRLWEIVHLLGINSFEPEAAYKLTKADQEYISSFLNDANPFVVIAPFSSDRRRNWISEYYIPIIEHLHEIGDEIILVGTKEQKKELEFVNQLCDHSCTVLPGNLRIPQLAALLSRAELVIAPDNGALHLARSVNTPTIGLYWAPNAINWAPLTRNKHAVLIQWNLHCPICGIVPNQPPPFLPQDKCLHAVSFIQEIKPIQVIEQIDQLINTTSKATYE